MLDRLTANLDFHGEALALRGQRQQLLASNIANADTPGYLARDFDFGSALRQAAGVSPAVGEGGARRLALAAPTGAAGAGAALGGSQDRPALLWRTPEQVSLDGNTVDMDRERAAFAENSLRYEATLRFVNGSVRNMLSAIRGE